MKKSKIIIFLFLFSALLFSCKTQQSHINTTSNLSNSLLWKIERPELQSPSYLFGTIHLIDAKDYFLPQNFDSAFSNAENIVFEIDMDDMEDMGKLMSLLPLMMMNDNQTLEDLLSEDDYKYVDSIFNAKGLPLFIMGKIKPLLLSAFAETDISPESYQNGDYKSYEFEFQKMAKESNKKVSGLETMEYQISIFDSIPYKEQAQMLIANLREQGAGSNSMDDLIKLYKEQKINDLYSTSISEDFGKFENLLLNNRNNNWIPIMSEFMKESPSFFAVGAGHLAGENGVINLLRKEGYKVSPL
ncbi:MAG: TraB/GumN family protein [Saprospiraceae bacterium]